MWDRVNIARFHLKEYLIYVVLRYTYNVARNQFISRLLFLLNVTNRILLCL